MSRRRHTKVTPVKPGKKPPKSGRVYSTYDREYQAKPEQVKKRVARNAARRAALKEGRVSKGDGKDVHSPAHGKGRKARGKVESASKNRARKP